MADELDTTDVKVRAAVYGMVAEAYGHVPGQDAPLELGSFCTCGHHTDEHHGPDGTLACSECGCEAFAQLTVGCPDCGHELRAGDFVCSTCGLYAEEIAWRIRRDSAAKSSMTLSGDDTAGECDHNKGV
jgi:hypothetical protein